MTDERKEGQASEWSKWDVFVRENVRAKRLDVITSKLRELTAQPEPRGSEALRGLVTWLRNFSEERMKNAMARESSAKSMDDCSEEDLKAAKKLAEKMAGRKLPLVKTDVESNERDADMQRRLASKLEREAKQIAAWADELESALAAATAEVSVWGDLPCGHNKRFHINFGQGMHLPTGIVLPETWSCAMCKILELHAAAIADGKNGLEEASDILLAYCSSVIENKQHVSNGVREAYEAIRAATAERTNLATERPVAETVAIGAGDSHAGSQSHQAAERTPPSPSDFEYRLYGVDVDNIIPPRKPAPPKPDTALAKSHDEGLRKGMKSGFNGGYNCGWQSAIEAAAQAVEAGKTDSERIRMARHIRSLRPSPAPRCQERNPEVGQCELREGHDGKHLGGYLMWKGPSPAPPQARACQTDESGNHVMNLDGSHAIAVCWCNPARKGPVEEKR